MELSDYAAIAFFAFSAGFVIWVAKASKRRQENHLTMFEEINKATWERSIKSLEVQTESLEQLKAIRALLSQRP